MSLETRLDTLANQVGLDIKQIKSDIPDTTESPVATVADAQGATLGLEQNLLASSGQIGKTVLAVAYVNYQASETASVNTKAQVTSLGFGNVMFVYASGSDFTAGNIQEGPVFLGDGETYVIESVQAGSIITMTEGGYGFSQQRNDNDESPMPLMSYALAFKDSFLYAFRNSQSYDAGGDTTNQGWVHIVNGPIASSLTFRDASGTVVQGQENIELAPWQYHRLYTNANGEYRVTSTNPVMCAVNASMRTSAPRFFDSRLVLPVTNDGVSWPRSGFISALYAGTVITNYVNDLAGTGASPTLTVNSGIPLDWDAGGTTGASDQDYEPRGATRLRASGLVTAYSGADSAGLEASPLCPVSNFTQKIATPLYIRNAGDGGDNGIAIASIYTGTARVYQWNESLGKSEIVTFNDPSGSPTTEIELIRRNNSTAEYTATTADEQLHPASALISAQGSGGTDAGAYDMLSDFTGGYIEVDVPATVVFNSQQNENGTTTRTFRGTSGSAVVGIHSDDDEQLTFGIIPDEIRTITKVAEDRMTYKLKLAAAGVGSWVLA